jgi:hypothetical protein
MDISPDSKLISTFRSEDLAEYLQLQGWREAQMIQGPWRVFTNDNIVPRETIEIVVPNRGTSLEGRMHIASSINLLSQLTQEEPESIIQRVQYRNYDMLQIRNTETKDELSLDLQIAVQQVRAMKSLITYGASSEDSARPYFQRPQGRLSATVLRNYRFGHTFPGSFGFTLTSHAQSPTTRYVQDSMFPDEVGTGEIVIAPAERRVMERIVRGLRFTQDAVKMQQPEQLARQYPSGFNGNMCKAIVDMSYDKTMPLEYRVIWSPRIPPSDDVQGTQLLGLAKIEFASLETAHEMLRQTDPEYKPIRGLVTDLRSSDNPFGLEAQRTVALQWVNKDIAGPRKVIVSLESQDYQSALKAHAEWQIVEITGLLQRLGNYWKLSDPREFRIID